MKKLGIFILACFLIVGCSQKESPADMYKMVKDALKVTNEADGINMEFDMTIDMKVDEQAETMKIAGSMLMDLSTPEKVKYKMNMGMDMAGQTIEVLQYYNDGYLYVDMFGMKIKQEMSKEVALLQAETLNSTKQEFSEDLYKDAKLTKSGDDTVITMEVDGEMMSEESANLLEQFNMGALVGVNMEYGKVSIKSVINRDGAMSEQTLVLPVTISANGETVEMVMTMATKFKDIGQPVVVDFPDFSEFVSE